MGKGIKRTAWATLVVTYLLIVAGGVVRVTGSGLGCGSTGSDWPLCHGGLVPPPDLATLIEFNHRIFATASSILIAVLFLLVWTKYRKFLPLKIAASAAMLLLIIQIVLGALTVEFKLPGSIVMVHLANAMLLLGTLVYIVVHIYSVDASQYVAPPTNSNSLIVATPVLAYILVLSGSFVVANGAGSFCAGWPLCGNGFELPAAGLAVLNLAHRIVAGVVVVFLGYAMSKIRRQMPGTVASRLAMWVMIAAAAQIAVGAAAVETHLATALRGTHIALAGLIWALTLGTALSARKLPTGRAVVADHNPAMTSEAYGVAPS